MTGPARVTSAPTIFRLLAIATCCAIAVLGVLTGSASAASTLVSQATNLRQLDIDGTSIYWSDGHKIIRVDTTNGLSNAIYRAPSKTSIRDFEARDGRVGIITFKAAKKRAQLKILAYTLGGTTQTLATSSETIYKNEAVCGTSLALGRLATGGEVLAIKDKFSSGKKPCRGGASFSSSVTGYSAGGTRVLFNGAYFQGSPLAKIGDIFNADLLGGKLLLGGIGVGVYDIASQQFVQVASGGRKSTVTGAFDANGNVLVSKYKAVGSSTSFQLFDAVSGYSNPLAVGSGNGGLYVETCGKYLMRTQYAINQKSANGVSAIVNPLIPDGPPASDPLPSVANSGTYLDYAGCDPHNVAYAVDSKLNSHSSLIYVSPIG